MIRFFALFFALTLVLDARSSAAQEDVPEEVRGVKIVIPMARGRTSWGTKQVTKALRKYIKANTGALIKSNEFSRVQKKLGHRGAVKYKHAKLAQAGRIVGANYVLLVTVSKKGWEFTAHALLINTVNGATDMDFRSGYFKPKVEGPDRGRRIGRTTLGKIAKLIIEGRGPPSAVATQDPRDELKGRGREVPTPAKTKPPSPPPKPTVASKDPLDERLGDRVTSDPSEPTSPPKGEANASDPLAERVDEPNDSSPATTPAAQPRLADSVNNAKRAVDADPMEPDAVADAAPARDESDDAFLHFRVGAGSNFAHTYKLSSASVENSGLSYPLSAMSLFSAHLQINVPGIGIGVLADVNFIPVRLRVAVDNAEKATPSATILDMLFGLNYSIPLTDDLNRGLRIVPGLGLRVSSFSVETNPGPIILSTASMAPLLLADLWLPLLETVDISIGIEAGYVAVFEEEPTQSAAGGSKGGFDVGGNLGLYLWLTDMVAVTFKLDTVFQQIDLSGAPNRQIPPNEDLQDPTVTMFDARGALGVELRI